MRTWSGKQFIMFEGPGWRRPAGHQMDDRRRSWGGEAGLLCSRPAQGLCQPGRQSDPLLRPPRGEGRLHLQSLQQPGERLKGGSPGSQGGRELCFLSQSHFVENILSVLARSLVTSNMFQVLNIILFPVSIAAKFVTVSWNTSQSLARDYILQVRDSQSENEASNESFSSTRDLEGDFYLIQTIELVVSIVQIIWLFPVGVPGSAGDLSL